MPVVPFAEWMPDQADLQNPGALIAKNALPTQSGYEPIASLNVTTNALDARPRGAIASLDEDLVSHQFTGDAAKLYERTDQTWGDVSKVGGYSTGTEEKWDFIQWKNKVIATNFSDDPQVITHGDTIFADLTTDFKARTVGAVRDFVMFGNTNDATDGNVPNRVRWSAIDDETDYTVSPVTLSDFQDIQTGGEVVKVVGGEYGVILMASSIWRCTFVGPPTVFQFDEVLPGIGAISSGSVVRDGDVVYFLSDRGFYAIQNGTQAIPIGDGKVDKFIINDLDRGNKHRMSSGLDAVSRRVFWAYPGADSVDGRPNKIIVFDQGTGRWSLIEQDVELIFRGRGIATTLDGLDSITTNIDDLEVSLDSRAWQGGAPLLLAFDKDFKTGSFSGPNMTATLETRELELNDGRHTRLNAFRPVVDGGTVTAKVGTRDRQSDLVVYSSSLTQSASGRFTTRANARYHRFQFTISGEWKDAIGAQVIPREARPAEYRG